MSWTDRDAHGNAPDAKPSVDGLPSLHLAVPVVVLSTIGQIAVRSITNEPTGEVPVKNTDGCFFVPVAPFRMPFTYVTSWLQLLPAAPVNGPWSVGPSDDRYVARLVLYAGAQYPLIRPLPFVVF